MSDIIMRFGKRVKFYRMKQKLSQEKLAELSGLHTTYIGQVERGEKNCTLETAEKIAGGLGVPLTDLIADVPEEVSKKLSGGYDSSELNLIVRELITLESKKLPFVLTMIDELKDL